MVLKYISHKVLILTLLYFTDFVFYYQAFKIEEKKMVNHQKFEEITTKYWELLRQMSEQDLTKTTISKFQYTELMKRVYKTLVPLYREKEMKEEIEQEWVMDSRGQSDLSFNLLTKVLFRIAHQWATNIDIDEYIELLNRIFNWITRLQCENGYGSIQVMQTTIIVEFPLDDKKSLESRGKEQKNLVVDEWLECRSDESNQSDHEYKYEEDPDNMVVKKFKKQKGELGENRGAMGAGSNVNVTIKEPFYYKEEVTYSTNYHDDFSPRTFVFADLSYIAPFGYYASEFLRCQKNEVHSLLTEYKNNSNINYSNMTQEQADKSSKLSSFQDSGLKEETGATIEFSQGDFYFAFSGYTAAKLTDITFNNFRRLLKDANSLSLRPYSQFPKPGRQKSRSGLNNQEPIVELAKSGYNPALERKVLFKLDKDKYRNFYYLLDQQPESEFYRMDINKIETKGKLCIKEVDEIKRDDEFNHVETSYKELRRIMLFKKYESIYGERSSADNKEQKRLKKIIEKEDKRKNNAMKPGNIAQKGISETYEEKSFIKMMKGPFYQLDSKEGLKEDDFINCAEQDLIDAARTQALRILVIGKPRSGKTMLAKTLSQKLDLVHINIENWLNALIAKIKVYEPPEDLEEGQAPPKWMSDLEENVNTSLLVGSGPSDDQIVEIIQEQMSSALAILKGYILDLSYYSRESSWASTIRQKYLLGSPDELGRSQEFSHIIELWCDDEEVKLRAQNMKVNPDDNVTYSRWEREERKKKKPLAEDEEEEDEETAIKPFDEFLLFQRSCDTEDRIKEELNYYNTVERPSMEELLINFHENQYIRLDSAGLTPEELTNCVSSRIKQDDDLPLRPLAIQIEGGGDYKSLLTEGLEENQLPRKWSLWKQIDPVFLSQGKVVIGQPENAAHFNGNVFVFSTEENMKAFLIEPKKYIKDRPSMPSIFRVLMLGPQGVGKHTQAQQLSETYGWRIIDFKELVKSRLEELMRYEIHTPNNPMQGGRIGLSEQELSDVIEGKAFPAWKFIPWIFDFLGFQLEKRKPPPPEEKQEGEEENQEEPLQMTEAEQKKKALEDKKKRDEEERKRKEEEEKEKMKDDRRRRRQEAIDQGINPIDAGIEESEEEPIIIEDLSIDQLVLKEDEVTGQIPFVGGFILIGFPETEEHINKLKSHGLEFDKIIYLNDTNEEEPGTEIKLRMKDSELYDWDWEIENSTKILGLAKEHLNEEIVREISGNGKLEEVFTRIRNEIDPFYIKIDNPDDVRVSADLGEEEKKLPKGDFGDYCPVTFVKDNWIVRGNPEQEVTIFGKTFWLSGEKEAESFRFNPKDYLVTYYGNSNIPLQAPPPRIMVMGHRGAGVKTQIRMLCDKYKLEEFNLKNEYFKKLREEKEQRKRKRLLDRGFRPLPPSEDDEAQETPVDPEIEEDPEDFDRESHERQMMKQIYDNSKGYVIDGNWRDIPEGSLTQNLQDLLFESRRVPEIVIILRCKEKATFDRIIDRESIKAEFNRLMDVREAEKQRLRSEERAAYIAELDQDEEKTQEEKDELITTWDENRDQADKDADDNDPDLPNYETMEQVERDKLIAERESDSALFEEFGQSLKDKQVFVIDEIKSDISAEFVHIKIVERIKDNIQFRGDLIEKQLAQPLTQKEVPFYEQSFIYQHSKFGRNSPLQLENPAKTKKNAVLYRERLYFLSNSEQQEKFLKEPSKYTQGFETIPLDLSIKPKIFLLGLPKSGKTTLAKKLAEKTGIVHLKMSHIIQYFIEKDSQQCEVLRNLMKREGRQIEDDQMINLLMKRIQFKDCQTRGWILEDFPKTKNQALFLAKRGLVPSNIIHLRMRGMECQKRTQQTQDSKFTHFRKILDDKIKYFQSNSPYVFSFYQKLYNNVVEIDAVKSTWYIEDRAIREISYNLQSRQNFARDYFLRESQPRPCKMGYLNMDRSLLKQSVSEFRTYCPVTWKNEKLLVKCGENKESSVLYKNAFYFFKTNKERDLFINNPSRFILNVSLPKTSELPQRFYPHKAAEIHLHEKALSAHCSVTLMDEERVKKGDTLLLIIFRDQRYVFDSEYKLQRFLANPYKYSKAQLPVKMPPPEDKISLFNLQKMEDSIAFMEQALGQVVTRGLREVSENRLKHPGMSVKETMLKLFSLFLKTENPANTEYMRKKYSQKMKKFIQRCELPEELYDLAMDKEKKKTKSEWPEFKENYYNTKGTEFDNELTLIGQEKGDNFLHYIR